MLQIDYSNSFLLLADEIKFNILTYLTDRELISLFLVCQDFSRFNHEDTIWKERLIRQLKDRAKADQFFETFSGWKAAYVNFKQMSKQGKVVSPREIHTANGEQWTGQFQNGQLINGKKVYPNGMKAKGEFQNGQLIKGKLKDLAGTLIEGIFKNGALHGYGKMILEFETQEGEFENNCLVKGKRAFLGDEIWEGEFKNSVLHGRGKKTYPDGSIQEGLFKEGSLKPMSG